MRNLLALFTFALLPAVALSTDYRPAEKRAVSTVPYAQDRTTRLAVSLGRATGAIPTSRVDELMLAINTRTALPEDLASPWQKLLRLAQTQMPPEFTRPPLSPAPLLLSRECVP